MLSEPGSLPISVLIGRPVQRRAVDWFHDFILT